MTIEHTLSIIKPDAVAKNIIGDIISRLEKHGLKIVAAKMLRLVKSQAEEFYAEHQKHAFFNDLVTFMVSGPIFVQVLEGENAILKNRDIIGATNPAEAATGTIRADFADSINMNAVHGSDSTNTAKLEIEFFFGNNI